MKISLITFQNDSLCLNIKKKYVCRSRIIPLGCDCHPAYVLKKLNLRMCSLPFDWMNTEPFLGLDYVNKSIDNCFSFFYLDLVENEKGNLISTHYPWAEFLHYPDLIDSVELKNRFLKKIGRFIDYYYNYECFFLFNITSEGVRDREIASLFVNSVKAFHRRSNNRHILLIYIRYDESFQENEVSCDYIERELCSLKNTRVVKYIRKKRNYGIWGDERKYVRLLKSLGISLRIGFPDIYFSWISKK